jgi:hypothetical protein
VAGTAQNKTKAEMKFEETVDKENTEKAADTSLMLKILAV